MTRAARFTTAVVLAGMSTTAAAQDRPTAFVHGLASSAGTWAAAAARLESQIHIAPDRPNLEWRDSFQSQASQMRSQTGLPSNGVAVGHSNGGLVAREYTKSWPLSAVVTVGTPNYGAPLAYNLASAIGFNWLAHDLIANVFYEFDTSCCEYEWVRAEIWYWTWLMQAGISEAVHQIIMTLGLSTTYPVLPQMSSQSSYIEGLNSGGNLAREAAEIPTRVAIVSVAHEFFEAGPLHAVDPDHYQTWATVIDYAPILLDAWADYLWLNADGWYANDVAPAMWVAATYIRYLEWNWCGYVSVPGAYACFVSDTVVPDHAQYWPGANYIETGIGGGPVHIRETTESDYWIYQALVNHAGISPRGGPPPVDDTLASGHALSAGESRRSADGRFELVYQGDGNLVLYRWDGVPIWASNTGGPPGQATMQGDGNLVVYDSGWSALWASNTNGNTEAYLRVENNGSIVVYTALGSVLWAAGGGY